MAAPTETLVEQNEPAIVRQACATLTKILNNILENPTEPKFRHLRKSGQTFQSKVWAVKGGPEFLSSIGFLDDGDWVRLPDGVSKAQLQDGLSALFIADRLALRRQEEAVLDRYEREMANQNANTMLCDSSVLSASIEDFSVEARPFFQTLDDSTLLVAARLLFEILSRILANPTVAKCRRINRTSTRFSSSALASPSGLAVMRDLGFVEGGADSSCSPGNEEPSCRPSSSISTDQPTWLVLPMNADINKLAGTVSLLQNIESDIKKREFETQREAVQLMRAKGNTAKSAAQLSGPNDEEVQKKRKEWHRDNEYKLTASQLVSEITAMMELYWLLEDKGGYVATFRKEQKRLLQKFKEDEDIAHLHQLKEEWERRLEECRIRTGRSLVSTIYESRPIEPEKKPTSDDATAKDSTDSTTDSRKKR